ncbi:MAG: RagB/SusD family nutrient uptake outer membrane protein [Prevotellaceae bacterium]|jgi:hypothetical protein|nr:RagB/SusD family nutrient uptake outer membrane protein [Prevotellaceae bacterium]
MKNRIKNLVIVFAAVFTLAGCNDFLTINNPGTINTDNFPVTLEQCEGLLTTCYAGTHRPGLYTWLWFPYELYLFDHTSDLFGAFGDRTYVIENHTDVNNINLSQTYIDIFKTIRAANEAMAGVEKYRSNAPANEHTALDYIFGQALFFRAFSYWHGQIFYEIDNVNGRGLPIFRKSPANVAEMSIPRNTTGECYAFMAEDLKAAIKLLKGHNDKYRADEWAARGLLAKVYMQGATSSNGYWQEAKLQMDTIFDESGKSLVSFDVYEKMFYGSPYEANEFNSESLYELDMINNPNQDGPWSTYTMGSGMPVVFGPTFVNLDIKIANVSDPWNATNGTYNFPSGVINLGGYENNFIHDANIRRFGFDIDTVPLLILNPAFNPAEAITTDNYPYKMTDDDYYQNSLDLRAACDPRLTVCAAQPWVDKGIDDKGRTTFYGRAAPVGGIDRTSIMGWWHKKFTNLNGIELAAKTGSLIEHCKNRSSDANIPVVRLADIYLLYAECMHNLGDDATALEYVNKVHRRAYGYDPNAPSPVDYASLGARTKAFDPTDILANDVIKYERWAELFAEGQWWWDVRRWKLQENEVKIYKNVLMGATNLQFRGNAYYVQPIPQLELDRNKNLEQSDGY